MQLLQSYTAPEVIQDYNCDKCSLIATRAHYLHLKSEETKQTTTYKVQLAILNILCAASAFDASLVTLTNTAA
jgi:hypothetical protein